MSQKPVLSKRAPPFYTASNDENPYFPPKDEQKWPPFQDVWPFPLQDAQDCSNVRDIIEGYRNEKSVEWISRKVELPEEFILVVLNNYLKIMIWDRDRKKAIPREKEMLELEAQCVEEKYRKWKKRKEGKEAAQEEVGDKKKPEDRGPSSGAQAGDSCRGSKEGHLRK